MFWGPNIPLIVTTKLDVIYAKETLINKGNFVLFLTRFYLVTAVLLEEGNDHMDDIDHIEMQKYENVDNFLKLVQTGSHLNQS